MATQLDSAGHGIDALWAEYKKTGAKALRDQLIVHYAPVVKYVAGRVSVGLPRHVDEADLASYGIIGLIDAIERFEPARNIKFETYAVPRIKGAIIDELRSIDWVPRSVRAKARAVEQSYSKLEASPAPHTDRRGGGGRPRDERPRSSRRPSARSPSSASSPSTRSSGAGTTPTGPPWARRSPTPPPGRWTPSR